MSIYKRDSFLRERLDFEIMLAIKVRRIGESQLPSIYIYALIDTQHTCPELNFG